jgi:transposase
MVEDEEYQLRHERVAGIDVAKAKADVCTRMPPAREGGRRASRVEEVPAAAAEILALAARLTAAGVALVVMESTSDYWRIWVRHEVAHVASELADWRAGLCGPVA